MKTFVIGDVHGRREQLEKLVSMLPRGKEDSLVFLGDLVDRGEDAPGVVGYVIELATSGSGKVICLRGNHEQMMLDFIEDGATLWLTPVTGGERTFEQYTGQVPLITSEEDFRLMRSVLLSAIPQEHLAFLHSTPLYFEDEYAIYVHAGLPDGKHPSKSDPHRLIWSRDNEFFRQYSGKPCIFGHTPTALLPLRGRLGRHGIYISGSAIGIDTGYNHRSPLSCLQLPDFTLYQTFGDGRSAKHQISSFMPAALRALQNSVTRIPA